MPFLDTSNKTLSLIIKIVLLVAFVLGIAWIMVSCGVNLWWDNEIKTPDADKAKYQFIIRNTGEYIFTDSYDEIADGFYILHGYYELQDNEYRWHESDLPLNEKYFGNIQVRRR